ncbi:prenyltransferase [Porphyromonadaceae bacterium OttesenSCG-928-L07]|nr:prenyltransferase [Porphyromonadaceae bacterium OttesenSCG-928-L07]MDL2252377.1 prenyltransferase [Odoribacter sp. OttesenSCG-928-J03]MDL2330986.1 prenyltransferase [Odoribacter sp. OttesenSCG-928-A06]
MKQIRFWLNNARTTALPQSTLPSILAFCMASTQAGFSVWSGILAIIGVALGHLGMNLFDDYFDYKKKDSSFRDSMAREGFRARISKCTYLTSGEATVRQLFIACLTFCGLAFAIGVVIFLLRGPFILYIALITAILGISYSGDPLRISYRGFGELLIGFMFGPLLMTGVYYSACGQFDISLLFISIPVGLLVVNILYVHSIMDLEPDKKVGKITLAVLLEYKKAILAALWLILFGPYLIILTGIIMYDMPISYLFTLLTLPMACALFYLMVQYVKDPTKSFTPKFWMGPMGRWEYIKQAGIDWFMIRWYLARNLLTFFCLIVIIIHFVNS